ncbi:MAG: hypothetical protein OXG72_16955, partial [Acidobacteria bacterium]|nr:hypothetical protein [Acidobacteriota bacterium]
ACVGCTCPLSSVHRDCSLASLPAQVHRAAKRVQAMRCAGASSAASFQLRPPSVETSTLRTAPDPDQARPVIVK